MSLQSDARDFTVSKDNFVQNANNHYEWSSNFISVEFRSSIRYWYPPWCLQSKNSNQFIRTLQLLLHSWHSETIFPASKMGNWICECTLVNFLVRRPEWASRPLLKHVLRNWTPRSFCLPYYPQNWKQSWAITWTSMRVKAYRQKSPGSSHLYCFVPCWFSAELNFIILLLPWCIVSRVWQSKQHRRLRGRGRGKWSSFYAYKILLEGIWVMMWT